MCRAAAQSTGAAAPAREPDIATHRPGARSPALPQGRPAARRAWRRAGQSAGSALRWAGPGDGRQVFVGRRHHPCLAGAAQVQMVRSPAQQRQFAFATRGVGQLDEQRGHPLPAIAQQVGIAVDGVLHLGRVGNAFGQQHFFDLVAHAAFVLELQAHRRAERQAALTPMRHGTEAALAPLPRASAQRQQAVDGDVHRTTRRTARCGMSPLQRRGGLMTSIPRGRASGWRCRGFRRRHSVCRGACSVP